MTFETKIGTYDISEENIITFKNGLPGFEQLRKFSVISRQDTEPIKWLVSLEDKDVALPVVDPWIAFKDYSITLNDAVLDEISRPKRENVIVFCVIDLHSPEVTVNLLAPVVINLEKGAGIQIILEGTNYTTRHPVRS